jgi:hypothetical protein
LNRLKPGQASALTPNPLQDSARQQQKLTQETNRGLISAQIQTDSKTSCGWSLEPSFLVAPVSTSLEFPFHSETPKSSQIMMRWSPLFINWGSL